MVSVLIIDDSAFVLRHHAEIAQEAGLQVFTAKSGEEGIANFDQNHPQIILCDIMMPDMDGYEVLENLQHINSHIFLYFVSAEINDKITQKAKKLGAKGVAMKPIELDTIKKILEHYQNR